MKRHLIAAIVLLALAALSATAGLARGARGAYPGDNGRIVFQQGGSDQGGGCDEYCDYYGREADIAVMNADGTGIVRITHDYNYDAQPTFSPSGRWIAFESFKNAQQEGDSDIYLIRPDGSGRKQLTFAAGSDGDPSWSGDGAHIAFESNRVLGGDRLDIWSMNADGTNQVRLTGDDASWDGDPAWSPDGTKIAFTSDRAGNKDVWVMNADGSSPVQLTKSPGTDQNPS